MCGEEGEIREIAEPHGIARCTRVRRREIGKREMYREAQSGNKGVEALKSRLLVTAFENGTGLLRWDEGFDEHLTEFLKLLLAAHLLDQQRHLDHVELVVELFNLIEVLLLHLPSRIALLAGVILLGESSWLTTMECVSIS